MPTRLRHPGTLLFEQQTRMVPTATAQAAGAKLELFTGAVLGCTAPFASLRAPLAPLLCLGAAGARHVRTFESEFAGNAGDAAP